MIQTMLDYLRITLYTLLAVAAFFLFQAWQKDHPREIPSTESQPVSGDRYVPQPMSVPQATTATTVQQTPVSTVGQVATGQLVTVTTDVLEATIDTRGGDIVQVKLLKYPESLGSKTPFLLLNDHAKTQYVAESGLLSKRGPDTSNEEALYTVSQTHYTLNSTDRQLVVNLKWQKNEVTVTKTFTFARNSYETEVSYEINNQSHQAWEGSLYTQLMRTNEAPVSHSGLVNLATYFGAAISTPQKAFQKVPFKRMQEENISQVSQDGWAAMIQHYFISAWIPPKTATSTYYSRVTANGLYTIGMIGQPLVVAPGTKTTIGSKLYTGPAIADQLEKTAPNLQLTIDYGWFWIISVAIFWMMQKIYEVVGNWGWSIVIVTIIIKLLFYQLSAKSYRSMSGLKKLQPKIEQLKQRYGDDRQKLTQATMELYKQEKVNPMTGCLPVLIQIPVFIALYWVLVESVELRQAPFIFWIHDLSQQDPYYVLPILMGASMFIQQRLNPPPADPLQAKLMMLMPIIFTVLFANFPAGLMLYWFVNNTLSFLQQWHIMYRLNKETNGHKTKG